MIAKPGCKISELFSRKKKERKKRKKEKKKERKKQVNKPKLPLTPARIIGFNTGQRVLARIISWKPRYSDNGEYERIKTPIHIVFSNEGKQRSIDLVPSFIEAPSIVDENPSDTNQSSIEQVVPDNNFCYPEVLISLSLEEDDLLKQTSGSNGYNPYPL